MTQQHGFTTELVLSCGLPVPEAFVQITGLSIAGDHVKIEYEVYADAAAPLNGLPAAEKREAWVHTANMPEAANLLDAAEARLKPLLSHV